MKYPCNLIRDILSLCHDQMAIKAADSYQKVYKKIVKKTGKIIGVTVLVVVGLILVIYAIIVGYFTISASSSKEIYTDINKYSMYRSGENTIDNFKVRGMNEIWPEKINDNMEVGDYIMVYYNPWDANYLGYLTIDYEDAEYEAELARLAEYPSTDYIGNYGATGFVDYEVIAMNAADDGFVYAITDGNGTIIYVELIFPGYGMDIDYNEYIPNEHLPKGLDAMKNNPTRQKIIEHNKAKANL